MELKLQPLILAITILSLSNVNGQQFVVQPNYCHSQPIQSYFDTPTARQSVQLVAPDTNILQRSQQMDRQQLQHKLNQELLQHFRNTKILPQTSQKIQTQGQEVRSQGQPSEIIIGSPSITNVKPFVSSEPYEPSTFVIDGIGKLRINSEYDQVGCTQTRSVNRRRSTSCKSNDISSTTSVKSSSQVVDLHQINNRANNSNPGEKDQSSPKIEFSEQVLKTVKNEIVNLVRNMSQDGSKIIQNISIDTADLQKILQKYAPISRYSSGIEGINSSGYNRTENIGNQDSESFISSSLRGLNNVGRQLFNQPQPSSTLLQNFGNNGWNPMTGNPSFPNYSNSWASSYSFVNNNQKPENPNYNAPPMISNQQPGNPKYNSPLMINNGQPLNSNYNSLNMNIKGKPGNHNYNSPSMNNNGLPGNLNYNSPSTNNNGLAGNLNYNAQFISSGRPGVIYSNVPFMNNNGLPGITNYNAQSISSERPGVFYSNVQLMNSGRPVITNPNIQNSTNKGFNYLPYNNYGNSLNFPQGYSINTGYQRRLETQTKNPNIKYSQGQSNLNSNINTLNEYQMPINPYQRYTRVVYS